MHDCEEFRERITEHIIDLEDVVSNPVFQRETAALKLIRAKLGNDVPILQTVFAPLNTAHNLAG